MRKLRSVMLLTGFLLNTHNASAGMPIMPNTNNVNSPIVAAREVLEAKLGRSLNAKQLAEFDKLAQNEKPDYLLQASTQEPQKGIFCVGGTLGAGGTVLKGACVHVWSMKTYDIGMFGVGFGLQAVECISPRSHLRSDSLRQRL